MAATPRVDGRAAVIGGGLMGHGIAQVLALAGLDVAVHDPMPEALQSVPERIAANLRALGIDREAPVGFTDIRVTFAIDAPAATAEQLSALQRKTERYCVVMQTLRTAPPIAIGWEP